MIHLEELNRELASVSAEQRLERSYEVFGKDNVVFSSSFGALSAGLCHLVSTAAPGATVYFLDTGFHFPETIAFRDALLEKLDLKLEVLKPSISQEELFRQLGDEPYKTNPDACCRINKVEPMERLMRNKLAWISGLRGGQNDFRAGLEFIIQRPDGKYKLQPILDWSQKDLYEYITRHDLPFHPLWEQGYTSIGCAPCTSLPKVLGDERSGRWAGQDKTECGLHLPPKQTGGPAA